MVQNEMSLKALKAAILWQMVLCRIILSEALCSYSVNRHMLTGHHFERLFQIDWLACIKECQSNSQCSSYNFCKQGDLGVCELNSCRKHSERSGFLVYASNCFFQQLPKNTQKDSTICEKPNDKDKAQWVSIPTDTKFCLQTTKNVEFIVPEDGDIINIKLTYRNGKITCNKTERHCSGRWGCRCCYNCPQTTNDRLDIIITDHENQQKFPQQALPDKNGTVWYTLKTQSNQANMLIFENLPKPLAVERGDRFFVWYSSNLHKPNWITDSDGSVCFDVALLYSKVKENQPF